MRLVRRAALRKLEARAASVSRAASGVGIVWSRDDSRVSRRLEAGELVAVDMTVLAPEGGAPAAVRMVERVTLDRCDLGFVYDAGGALVGRMVDLDGSLLTWEACAPLARTLAVETPPDTPRPSVPG